MNRYLPFYSPGGKAFFKEDVVFTTTIPIPNTDELRKPEGKKTIPDVTHHDTHHDTPEVTNQVANHGTDHVTNHVTDQDKRVRGSHLAVQYFPDISLTVPSIAFRDGC